MSEKVVTYDRKLKQSVLTSARGGSNRILARYFFLQPVVCKLDAYIKDSCTHKVEPKAGTVCGNCTTCNQCAPVAVHSTGAPVRFHVSPINEQARTKRQLELKQKRERQDARRAFERDKRYAKRAAARGSK